LTHFDPSDELAQLMKEQGRQMRKRPSVVYLLQMGSEFSVQTNEGVMTGHAGDWLAHDPQSGHFWPVSQEYVAMHYEDISGAIEDTGAI
jgi:hypothetical protein